MVTYWESQIYMPVFFSYISQLHEQKPFISFQSFHTNIDLKCFLVKSNILDTINFGEKIWCRKTLKPRNQETVPKFSSIFFPYSTCERILFDVDKYKNFAELLAQLVSRRSSRLQMFFKIGVLKNFAIFTGKRLYQSLFFIKPEGVQFY